MRLTTCIGTSIFSILISALDLSKYKLVFPFVGLLIWTLLYLQVIGFWDQTEMKPEESGDSFIRFNDHFENK